MEPLEMPTSSTEIVVYEPPSRKPVADRIDISVNERPVPKLVATSTEIPFYENKTIKAPGEWPTLASLSNGMVLDNVAICMKQAPTKDSNSSRIVVGSLQRNAAPAATEAQERIALQRRAVFPNPKNKLGRSTGNNEIGRAGKRRVI